MTDEWDNGLAGVLVTAENTGSSVTAEATTDGDGGFQFVGLAGGEWAFEFHADGYQPVRTVGRVRASSNRPIELELPVLPTGGRFRGDTAFEAESGTPKVAFDEHGTFEFEDANGKGEGTYGIVELSAVMVIRDYDGPDDTYSVNEPVVVTFASDQFASLTWGGTTLAKK